MQPTRLNRRHFLRAGLIGSSAAVTAATLGGRALAAVTKPEHDPDGGLKLGMASYTYRSFPLDKAIAMTKEAGFKYINLKDVHLPMKSTTEERQAARQKVEAAGLKLMGGGVISMKSEPEVQQAFEYARDAGMPCIVCTMEPKLLDLVEKKARKFNILIAIHNHGPTDKLYPSPLDVLALVKDRDPLMGICMDVGHTVRIQVDPIECLERCGDRMHDMHMKDETQATPAGKATELGHGVIDIVGLLKTLSARKFPYHIGLEYEAHEHDPQPYVMECAGYLRGVLAAIG